LNVPISPADGRVPRNDGRERRPLAPSNTSSRVVQIGSHLRFFAVTLVTRGGTRRAVHFNTFTYGSVTARMTAAPERAVQCGFTKSTAPV
jgi:urease beta subunit